MQNTKKGDREKSAQEVFVKIRLVKFSTSDIISEKFFPWGSVTSWHSAASDKWTLNCIGLIDQFQTAALPYIPSNDLL